MITNKEQRNCRRQFTAQFYKKNKISFCVAALSSLSIGALNLGIAWLMQQMIDTVSGVSGALSLEILAGLTVGLITLIVILKMVSYISLPRFMEKAMRQYKDYAFEKLTQKNIASFNKETTSSYISALSNDATSIENNYLNNLFTILSNAIKFIGSVIMMLIYSPPLTIIACAFFILPIVASLIAGKRVEKAERKVSDKYEIFIATLKDCLNGFSVVKSFKAEQAIIGLYGSSNAVIEHAKCEKRKVTTIISAIGGVAGVTAQLGTFLVGGFLAMAGYGITPGVLLIFIDLTANVINPIRDMPELFAARKAALALVDKLANALNNNIREDGVVISDHLKSGIEIRNLSFGYDTDNEVLHNLNVRFDAGKSYAIVGASGSGKSTLLQLLMAAHDSYKGEIRYDNNELKEVSSASLYDLVSLIQQNVFVFNASIRENITMFRDFPQSEVDMAIQQSGLAPLIKERGEQYRCGENGNGLSGGEKQRISIARSLLRKSAVLLVDEATAALDAQTAYQVSCSILGLQNMTRIVVTHNLDAALLKRYDCIVALRNGQIVELGTFDELMKQRNYFYSLFTVSQ